MAKTRPVPLPRPASLRRDHAERLATALKALADPARLRLLHLIASQPEGACACDMSDPLGLSQPTVSHHLKVLTEAGLLERERDGVWVCYRVRSDAVDALTARLRAVVGP